MTCPDCGSGNVALVTILGSGDLRRPLGAWPDTQGGKSELRCGSCGHAWEQETSLPFVDVVFDGPPAHESGRFVETEDPTGASVNVGEWIDRGNGLWALRIPRWS